MDLKTKRLISIEIEDSLIKIILAYVRKNKMTISNLKNITTKVCNYLEDNSVLKEEDLDNPKSSIQD